jgi:hypothetical protein
VKLLRSIKLLFRICRDPDATKAAIAQAKFWVAEAERAKVEFAMAANAGDVDAAEMALERMQVAAKRFDKETEALLK